MTTLMGRVRQLPDRRAHELFQTQAQTSPDAVAAVHGAQHLTYRELNARANRLARALMARGGGLRREEVVGVMTERNLAWLTAVLAIFKAGAVYLPIEPHFPADRISRMLTRSGCRLVLTEFSRYLPGAFGQIETVFIEAACAPEYADRDLGITVGPAELAYIYFTSGSTGEPKGAMCEHGGLLNHLFAKIDDLQIGAGTVVAQTAPQCFDISLWQLLAPLLTGGRTVIIDQETILDAARFLDLIAGERVNIVQVVPSYLEVLVASLAQQPREFKLLEFVVATGEALKKELVERWFGVQPRIRLVNAYGLTETSDDTNHEIMDAPPIGDRVPLGRPVNNVVIHIVDEQLRPVTPGEPGEIVFSGVCVGRGYINDLERTRSAFVPDPRRPSERLYRSGDYGRALPDGKLEFLGRRDAQVKINGFRIEIGDVESALLHVPGVRAAAVVVHHQQLVAFCAGDRPLDAAALREALGRSLPNYMVPAAIHCRDRLPLTENGKIDRKALTAFAVELEHSVEQPSTAMERRVAEAWASVLGIPRERIGSRDDFFALGGTSLSALKLVIALDRAMSLKDVNTHAQLADQALLLERKGVPAVHAT